MEKSLEETNAGNQVCPVRCRLWTTVELTLHSKELSVVVAVPGLNLSGEDRWCKHQCGSTLAALTRPVFFWGINRCTISFLLRIGF